MLRIDIIDYENNRSKYNTLNVPKYLFTDDNFAIWNEYICHKISSLITEETMSTPEFREAEERVRAERERQLEWELALKKKQETEQRRKYMTRPRINYIPKGLTVDYEKEYSKFFEEEVTFKPLDSDDFLYQFRLMNRWQAKSVPQIIELGRPDAAYAIAIELCRHIPAFINRKDLQDYIRKYKNRVKKMIVESFLALATSVKAWNNEEKRKYVNDFISEQSKCYSRFRGLEQELMQMLLPDVFTGEPVSVTREMNNEEAYIAAMEAHQRRLEEQKIIEAEREAKSLIPLSQYYENSIFNSRNPGWNYDLIAREMYRENKIIKSIANNGDYRKAITLFLQMTKSLCRHYISDEHWCYYDDMYDPEYALNELIDFFSNLITTGELPDEDKEYLLAGWQEILGMESATEYGMPYKTIG